jgi:hypothetical protein
MIKAWYQSWNFEFTAYGQTTAHAVNALKRGFDQHAKQYGLEPDWWKEFENDINTVYIQLNQAYRDDELLKVKA